MPGTTIGLMAVSLTHLSDGVTQLTEIPAWQGWAMAVRIDCMLIAVALALLTATVDVKKDIATVAHAMEAGALGMSAYLNSLAFTGGTFDMQHATQILFGCFVPRRSAGRRTSWRGSPAGNGNGAARHSRGAVYLPGMHERGPGESWQFTGAGSRRPMLGMCSKLTVKLAMPLWWMVWLRGSLSGLHNR